MRLGVGDDGELGHLGTGAAGGGDSRQGRERSLHLLSRKIVAHRAAVRGQEADGLGGVHRAPAAYGNQPVAALRVVEGQPLFHRQDARVRLHLAE